MRFVVEIPEMNTNSSISEYWQQKDEEIALRDLQLVLIKVWPKAKAMIDDRPDPMDFVKSISVGHSDGSTCVQVEFTNGYSICSCSWQKNRVTYVSHIPNLREGR